MEILGPNELNKGALQLAMAYISERKGKDRKPGS